MERYYAVVFSPTLVAIFRQIFPKDPKNASAYPDFAVYRRLFDCTTEDAISKELRKQLDARKSLRFSALLKADPQLKARLVQAVLRQPFRIPEPAPGGLLGRFPRIVNLVQNGNRVFDQAQERFLLDQSERLVSAFSRPTGYLAAEHRFDLDRAHKRLEQINHLDREELVEALADFYIDSDEIIHKTKENWDAIYRSILVFYLAGKVRLGTFDLPQAQTQALSYGLKPTEVSDIDDLDDAYREVVRSIEVRRAERILDVRERALAIFEALKMLDGISPATTRRHITSVAASQPTQAHGSATASTPVSGAIPTQSKKR